MRIWRGIEAEHNFNFGKPTLFVESENPNLDVVKAVLSAEPDIVSIYFGAGEVDITNWKWIDDLDYLFGRYSILLECSISNIPPIEVCEVFDFIIVRSRWYDIFDNMQIKIRDDENVYIAGISKFKRNSLIGLKDNRYSSDILLYEDFIKE